MFAAECYPPLLSQPALTVRQLVSELAQNRLSHDIQSSKGTNNQIHTGNLGEDCWPTQMAYVKKDEPKQKCEEEQRKCPTASEGAYHVDKGQKGKDHQEPTDIRCTNIHNAKVNPQVNTRQGHPEGTIGVEGRKAKIVPRAKLLEASNQLHQAPKE